MAGQNQFGTEDGKGGTAEASPEEMSAITYCLIKCDYCGLDLTADGVLLEEANSLQPVRKLLCEDHAEMVMKTLPFVVIMKWTNFRVI